MSTMKNTNRLNYLKNLLENLPSTWLKLTTHRLDIYNEKLAKLEFLDRLETLFSENNTQTSALSDLPTAFDYIRLGHPLSCLLEWTVSHLNDIKPAHVISFSSKTIPILAVLRKNLLDGKKTRIIHIEALPGVFYTEIIKNVYNYNFEALKIEKTDQIPAFEGSTLLISQKDDFFNVDLRENVDFLVTTHSQYGSILLVNGEKNESYVSEIQHVRRRETIAMTPAHCFSALKDLVGEPLAKASNNSVEANQTHVLDSIKEITNTNTRALLSSSGLSIQYAIMMGLIHEAHEKHKGKGIKIIVPPNCYGGTNDQARRVAACIENVEVLDLPVDGGKDMVRSIDGILENVASEDAVSFIIAEIPTNPRVEVPDLEKLKSVLSKERKTKNGQIAVDPVFILDQTFCPNVHFLGEGDILSTVRTIAYVSGSKFPSGGLCTSGYCVANKRSESLLEKIELHLKLCDNEATGHQIETLSQQLPSMNQRISDAYKNTREFVDFILESLPTAKINFVSQALAEIGFTPSVFSLDLPTKGKTAEEQESYKRALNHQLIDLMIKEIPTESKHCVSYGQLSGCYWTIPATSTQGTTKEGDKDYIVRVSASPNMDVELHKKIFAGFVAQI